MFLSSDRYQFNQMPTYRVAHVLC